MVYPLGVVAALCLAVGYVLQQRAAAGVPAADVLHWRLLLDLVRRPSWLRGIGFMVIGELLAAWALTLAGVALVEPLLSTNLLFAFALAARLGRMPVRWPELAGAALISAALGGFIVAGDPSRATAAESSRWVIVLALAVTAAVVLAAVAVARTRSATAEAVLLSAAAGILLGLQDAATRQALLGRPWTHVFVSPWSAVVLVAAVTSLLLLQSAFREAPLAWSLPPLVAAEPIAGVALGVSLLGDRVDSDPGQPALPGPVRGRHGRGRGAGGPVAGDRVAEAGAALSGPAGRAPVGHLGGSPQSGRVAPSPGRARGGRGRRAPSRTRPARVLGVSTQWFSSGKYRNLCGSRRLGLRARGQLRTTAAGPRRSAPGSRWSPWMTSIGVRMASA